MKMERIATVKATGKKYIVQQLDFRTGRCHCWGELMDFEFRKNVLVKHKYEAGNSFPLEAVSISNDVALSPDLMSELFAQAKVKYEEMIAQGKMLVHEPKRGRR